MLTDDEIRTIFLQNGFTVKEGNSDLKPYVFEAARALLAAADPEKNAARYCFIKDTTFLDNQNLLEAMKSGESWDAVIDAEMERARQQRRAYREYLRHHDA